MVYNSIHCIQCILAYHHVGKVTYTPTQAPMYTNDNPVPCNDNPTLCAVLSLSYTVLYMLCLSFNIRSIMIFQCE